HVDRNGTHRQVIAVFGWLARPFNGVIHVGFGKKSLKLGYARLIFVGRRDNGNDCHTWLVQESQAKRKIRRWVHGVSVIDGRLQRGMSILNPIHLYTKPAERNPHHGHQHKAALEAHLRPALGTGGVESHGLCEIAATHRTIESNEPSTCLIVSIGIEMWNSSSNS